MSKLIVISMDALIYEDLENLKNFQSFGWLLENGARVNKVRSIYPSLTYPCHTTMLTGNYPQKHGVINNEKQLPGMIKLPWLFYHDAVKCRDIHDAAKEKDLVTASFGWPVTGNHPSVDYLLDEAWPDGEYTRENWENAYLTTGSTEEFFREIISPILWMRIPRTQPETSYFNTQAACETIRRYKPDLVTLHVGNMDAYRHKLGVFDKKLSTSGAAECEKILTDIITATKDAGVFEETDFVITSDHGQMDCTRVVNPNVLLAREGFIDINEMGEVIDWQAWSYNAGMSAQIVLKNPDDNELKNKLYCILSDYAAEGVWGFEKVYTVEETAANDNLSGNFSFVLETDDYTEFDNAWTGNYAVPCNKTLTSRRNGAHGFHPSKGPNPTFIGCGPHFKKGVEISEARLVDQAPTYAAILGLNLGETDGKPIVELLN